MLEPGLEVLRCRVYGSMHRSFFSRTIGFLSFMWSSFWTGLRVKNVDLVWGTSPPLFQSGSAWALARSKRVPFLFEVRDLLPYFAVAMGVLRQPLLIHLSQWFERFLYRKADRVIVNSPGYIEHVLQNGARNVDLIPNGVDILMFNPLDDGAAFRQDYGLEGKFVALYSGAHGMANDLGVVLDAAERLRDQTEIVFVFLGDGKEKPALMAKAKAMKLPNVLFLPPVPKAEMSKALAAADICIAILQPIDAYKITYPNKVFDYMAAGRPIILAIDGVIKKVIENAGAGIAVPPGDAKALAKAVSSLAADHKMARQMGQVGRHYVIQHFDREKLAAYLERIMEDIINAQQTSRHGLSN